MTGEVQYRGPFSDPVRLVLIPLVVAILAVFLVDATTNSIDTEAFKWDWVQYKAIAEHGLQAESLVSPFAYRYATPMLAAAVHSATGLPVESSFRVLAYAGAVLQLLGVFLFVLWIAQSRKAAWAAMLVVLFSIMHVKFQMFDVYRPDSFAYAFVLAGSWLALRKKLLPLILVTAVGLQFREFAGVPLAAYVLALVFERDGKDFILASLVAFGVLLVAVVLPRMLIPVAGHHEYLALTGDGWLAPLTVLLNFKRDLNVLYAVAIYTAPVMVLTAAAGWKSLRAAVSALPALHRRYLVAYTALVLVLTLYGGTDLARFVTYLCIPVLVLFARMAANARTSVLVYVLAAVFVLNAMWMPIPASDQHAYNEVLRMFGHSDWLRWRMLYRVLELLALTGGAWSLGKFVGRDEALAS